MDEKLTELLDKFNQAFDEAYNLRLAIMERIEEITDLSRYDFDDDIESDDNWVFGINEYKLEKLLNGEEE